MAKRPVHRSSLVAKGLPDEEIECSRAEGCGSINEVGWRFQSFGINDLEMVDQMFASWNQVACWLRRLEELKRAAWLMFPDRERRA